MTLRSRQHLTLLVSTGGAMIVALDGTVLLMALPTMQRDLHASLTQVQWASTGYLIAVASLLVLSGRLGDRHGHGRVFAVGVLGFAASSAGISMASDVGWVIALRVAQGIFGALLQPATLGMLRAVYPPDRLGMPIAVRSSAIAVAATAGPIVGGALVASLGWRAVFVLNVPFAVAIAALAVAVPMQAPPRTSGVGLNPTGACLFAGTLASLVYTLVDVPGAGWVASAAGAGGTVVLGAVFWWNQRRSAHPLVPSSVLRSPGVVTSLVVLVAAAVSMFGTLFVATYFLQDVLRLDPLASGLQVLPLTVMILLGSLLAGVVVRRRGPRGPAAAAMAAMALGIALLSRIDLHSTPTAIGAGLLVLGAGFGTVMVVATTVVVAQAPVAAGGVVGGLQQTAMNVGPALGVAMATTTMTLVAPQAAMAMSLLIMAAVALGGALLGLRMPRRLTAGSGSPEPVVARAPSPLR